MRPYLISAMVLLPLFMAQGAQTPVFDPSTQIYGFSSEEILGGKSYLGVDTRDVTPDRISVLKLKDESGVEVTMVDQDAPAGKAGIKEQDVILTLNGSKVESVEQLRRMIREVPPGRVINLGISRNGQPVNMQVQLAERGKIMVGRAVMPDKTFKVEIPQLPSFADMDLPVSVVVVHSSLRSGLMVENLTPQLGEFFGAREGHGVLVRSVERGSHAEKAGFRAGDVIIRVAKEPVQDSSDFSHALQSHRGNTVAVTVIRDKKEQTINLAVPEQKQSGDIFEEESFEFPDVEVQADLGEISSDLELIGPAVQLSLQKVRKADKQLRKELQKQQQEMKKQQKELQQQQWELQLEQQDENLELQNQFRHQQRELQHELQRELRELQDESSEI